MSRLMISTNNTVLNLDAKNKGKELDPFGHSVNTIGVYLFGTQLQSIGSEISSIDIPLLISSLLLRPESKLAFSPLLASAPLSC